MFPRSGSVTSRVGRNSPCPCGSGRKYKVCCLRTSSPASASRTIVPLTSEPAAPPGRFRFQPGSYGSPDRGFFPSIACFQRLPSGGWDYHFILVTPNLPVADEEVAALQAGGHLFEAFQGRAAPEALAMRLKAFGYASLAEFRIAAPSSTDEGFRIAPDAIGEGNDA